MSKPQSVDDIERTSDPHGADAPEITEAPEADQTAAAGPLMKRRDLLVAAGGAGLLGALGAASAGSDLSGGSSDSGDLRIGAANLQKAYHVAGGLYIGPETARSTIDPKAGRMFLESDTDKEFWGDGSDWQWRGVNAPSITTEEIVNTYDEVITPTRDAETVINNLSSGDAVIGAGTHDISATLSPPENVTIASPSWTRLTLNKTFNGTLFEDNDDIQARNVVFDGNRQNGFTGDVIRNTSINISNPRYEDCYILNAEGDNYVLRGSRGVTFRKTQISQANGFGIRIADVNEAHRSLYLDSQSEVRFNGQSGTGGGIRYERGGICGDTIEATVGDNLGPGIEFHMGSSNQSNHFGGKYTGRYMNNDGPAILVTDGVVRNPFINARFRGNVDDMVTVGQTVSSPRGQIHQEGGQIQSASLTGGQWGSLGTDAAEDISRQGGSYSHIYNFGAQVDNGVEGSGSLNWVDYSEQSTSTISNCDGRTYRSDPFNVGASLIIDHANDMTFIHGFLANDPASGDISTSNALYPADGSGTPSAGWRITTDGGSNWSAF